MGLTEVRGPVEQAQLGDEGSLLRTKSLTRDLRRIHLQDDAAWLPGHPAPGLSRASRSLCLWPRVAAGECSRVVLPPAVGCSSLPWPRGFLIILAFA